MAARYWVAGSTTWSSTASWSTTSGGAGGASVPGAADDAIFDTNSGLNFSVTVDIAATVNSITLTPNSGSLYSTIAINSSLTTGNFTTTGTAGNNRILFTRTNALTSARFVVNGTVSISDCDFKLVYVSGTASPISGTRIATLGVVRGVTASAPKTVYWVTAAGGNWSGNNWAATSGGAASTDNFPLAQDTAKIENTGLNTSATVTINQSSNGLPISGVDMSTRTNAMTLATSTNLPSVYGDWKNGSGTTLTGTTGITFVSRGTLTVTSNGIAFTQPLTFQSTEANSYQLADALNVGSGAISVTVGYLDTKNYNITAGSLTCSATVFPAGITLGSSTVTLSGTSPLTITNTNNITFSSGTSQINLSNASATYAGSGTFYNVTFTSTSAGTRALNGLSTFNNLTVTAPSSAGIAVLAINGANTINGTLTVAGSSAVQRVFLQSTVLGTARTLTVNSLSATDCDFRDITIAGTAAGSSPTRAGDCGGNTGITFPGAKTVYWNLAGAQNWSATGWATSSGGSPAVNNFPLAQDTAKFDNTGSVTGTITIDAAWNIGTFDASARTSAMTLTTSTNTPSVYGDWKFGTGVTSSSTSGTISFGKRGTQTITSNGITFGCPITVNSISGTVQLADAFTIDSTRVLTATTGTFNAVSYNVTIGTFSAGFSAILKMGSGTWTLAGTGTVWNCSSSPVLYKGTANIVLSDTSTTARTFSGGSLAYNKITIGGTTGTSTLTFDSNNTFSEIASTKTVAHTIALGTTSPVYGKWSVTGTAGNVVTVTGTATITIAGARVSGVDYLAMGTTTLSTTSPGEFYAGANSTGTGAGITLTAAPAATTRYWVGGTGTWDATTTTNWSTTSGGSGGASVPTSADAVVFNSSSNATAYTVTCTATQLRCGSLTIAGPASGNVTWAGSGPLAIHGSVSLPASGITRSYTGAITLSSSSTGLTFTSNGVQMSSAITVNGVGCEWTLGSALDTQTSTFTLTNGTFSTSTYNFTVGGVLSNSSAGTRTLTFGSGTITIQTANGLNFGNTEAARANLTFNKGTSQITLSTNGAFNGNNQSFYNVSYTVTATNQIQIAGENTFNNLTFSGVTSVGARNINLSANQTISGTLTFSAGTNATMRNFLQSDTIGTTRTLTVAAFSGTDVDFRDIAVTGAAAPISGTRLGDAKGNSGITFVAGKTVYCRSTGSANWSSSTGWSATSGGSADVTQFPLAQDTAVFPAATYPASGSTITIDQSYNIGTIDMSARTSNTMTLATSTTTPAIYGNWINGTGTTLSGTGTLTFAGRGAQTITSAGKSFTQPITTNSIGGSVTLQDAFTSTDTSGSAISLTAGTFNAATYNVTLSGGIRSVSGSLTKTLAFGSGTWTISYAGLALYTTANTNLTVTGTGTISFTSASAKSFDPGLGTSSYSGITINQGGAGELSISSPNNLKNITNTYSATGATSINFTNSRQVVTQFTATGASGKVLTLKSNSGSSPASLILSSGVVSTVDYLTINDLAVYAANNTWYAGANSTNGGVIGWTFSVYVPPATSTGKFFLMFG